MDAMVNVDSGPNGLCMLYQFDCDSKNRQHCWKSKLSTIALEYKLNI